MGCWRGEALPYFGVPAATATIEEPAMLKVGSWGIDGDRGTIGDINDDPEMEIIATYDNHHIQAFHHDGVAIDSAATSSSLGRC